MRGKFAFASLVVVGLAAGCNNDPPRLEGLTPTSGPLGGGTTVNVSGVNFDTSTIIYFNGVPLSNIQLVGSGALTAVTPPGSQLGGVMVTVRNKDGQRDKQANGFVYTSGASAVSIASVTPNSGAAGTQVTISGSGFQANATVQFGSTAATNVTVTPPSTITCTAPTGSGAVNVTVTNTDGGTFTLTNGFTYGGTSGGKTITTFAGTGQASFSGDNGAAAAATLNAPEQLVVGTDGSVYFADTANNRVRKILAGTFTISTLTGNAGELNQPRSVALDAQGNVYIADTGNQVVRKLVGTTLTVVAGTAGTAGAAGNGGAATAAQLSTPSGVSVDGSNNVFIADTANHEIRRVDGATQMITQFAGTGTAGTGSDAAIVATTCALNSPQGVLVDSNGNVFIADTGNARIRKVTGGVGGTIATFAGGGQATPGDNGLATNAKLTQPVGLAEDANGVILIADMGAHVVRSVTSGTIALFAGNYTAGSGTDNVSATASTLNAPRGIAVAPSSVYYVADTGNNKIRKVQ